VAAQAKRLMTKPTMAKAYDPTLERPV